MVFPSVSDYLDPPIWHHPHPQAQNNQQVASGDGDGNGSKNPQFPPPPPPVPATAEAEATHHGHMGNMGTTIRPGSMADRARMARVPQPEAGLKCPRCESTNTKFCYFNNYSLLQPRHFCKTCRRYWTRGGALRSVPVGGGSRRNKRSSSGKRRSTHNNYSKSPSESNSHELVVTPSSDNKNNNNSNSGGTTSSVLVPEMFNLGHHHLAQMEPSPSSSHLQFMPSLHNFGGHQFGMNENIGLNIDGGILNQTAAGGVGILSGSGGTEQWRMMGQMQQFPFLGGQLEQHNNLYDEPSGQQFGSNNKINMGSGGVKMEQNQHHQAGLGLNLPSQFLGMMNSESSEYWGGLGSSSSSSGAHFFSKTSA